MNKNILDAIKGILYSTEPDGTLCDGAGDYTYERYILEI